MTINLPVERPISREPMHKLVEIETVTNGLISRVARRTTWLGIILLVSSSIGEVFIHYQTGGITLPAAITLVCLAIVVIAGQQQFKLVSLRRLRRRCHERMTIETWDVSGSTADLQLQQQLAVAVENATRPSDPPGVWTFNGLSIPRPSVTMDAVVAKNTTAICEAFLARSFYAGNAGLLLLSLAGGAVFGIVVSVGIVTITYPLTTRLTLGLLGEVVTVIAMGAVARRWLIAYDNYLVWQQRLTCYRLHLSVTAGADGSSNPLSARRGPELVRAVGSASGAPDVATSTYRFGALKNHLLVKIRRWTRAIRSL